MLPWQPSYCSNKTCGLSLLSLGTTKRNINSVYDSAKDKGVAGVSLWLPWQHFHLGNLVYDNFELSLGIYVPNMLLIRFQTKGF